MKAGTWCLVCNQSVSAPAHERETLTGKELHLKYCETEVDLLEHAILGAEMLPEIGQVVEAFRVPVKHLLQLGARVTILVAQPDADTKLLTPQQIVHLAGTQAQSYLVLVPRQFEPPALAKLVGYLHKVAEVEGVEQYGD